MIETLPERFIKKIDFTDTCWVWKASKSSKKGYGQFKIAGKFVATHRFMWNHFNGEIPEGQFVCHTCDNPSCINPSHLFLGTNQDNVNDMVKKGRNALGEKNGQSKLTNSAVEEIRKIYQRGVKGEFSLRGIAEKYGVEHSTIYRVVNHKQWM